MDASQARHPVHVLRGGVDVPVLQVVEDGVVEQNCILQRSQCRGWSWGERGDEETERYRREGRRGEERGIKVRLQRIYLFFFIAAENTRLQTKARVGGRKRHNANDKNTVLAPSVQITL